LVALLPADEKDPSPKYAFASVTFCYVIFLFNVTCACLFRSAGGLLSVPFRYWAWVAAAGRKRKGRKQEEEEREKGPEDGRNVRPDVPFSGLVPLMLTRFGFSFARRGKGTAAGLIAHYLFLSRLLLSATFQY
jgi:hypothetical protein